MSTLLSADKVYELVVKGRADGQAILNILHFRTEEDPFVPNADATMEAWFPILIGAWQSAVCDHVGSTYAVDEYVLTEILQTTGGNPPPGPPNTLVFGHVLSQPGGPDDIGAQSANTYPTYTAVGYRKVTAMRGRNKRGSLRLGTVPTAMGNFDVLTAPGQANFAAANLDPLRRQLIPVAANFPMVMCVFAKTDALRAPPTLELRDYTEEVVSFILNPNLTSQVSRKRVQGIGQ